TLNSFLGRSGEAVGLSAISFSATLQKDAAPIPNALGRTLELKKRIVRTWLAAYLLLTRKDAEQRRELLCDTLRETLEF
ncbi:MAG: hypothetical protein J6Q61_05610, partial [Bacteroidales bacterium]|nr:hypothetical protein [Bacteroidales bacterium]